MITIRNAQLSDAPHIVPLMEQLGYPIDLTTMKQQLKRYIQTNGYGIVLAEQNGRIVGFIAWSQQYLFMRPIIRIHIEGLVVDQRYRKQGIGKKLIQHIETIAKQNKPCLIDLTSGMRRAIDGTHDFYHALGYHNTGLYAQLYLRKEFFE